MPVLKGIHGSNDATSLPSLPCLHKWERGEADDEKKSHLERCFSINMIELHQRYVRLYNYIKNHIKTRKEKRPKRENTAI